MNHYGDVAQGGFQQSEFAADLTRVYKGTAPREYSEPIEFFSRTYLTEGLNKLLLGAVTRLNGKGGDPIVQLQTNFGGGKTHSMLALYHMVGGVDIKRIPNLEQLLSAESTDIAKLN